VQDKFDTPCKKSYTVWQKGGAWMVEHLGARIRKTRERFGISQAELARRIRISKQAMYQIENNITTDPGVMKVKAIADVLDCSVDALLGRKVKAQAA
jgi:transcriptional regulator with XRE-family HTH domain